MTWKFLVSLGTQVIMLFCWDRQVKECFAEAGTGERMFCSRKHLEGHMMFIKNLTMTPQTVGALVCLAPPQ